MAGCAAVGCSEPALEVWKPEGSAPRFHYLVCEFHGLALHSDARFTFEGEELRIESLPRLLDWNLTQAGAQAIVRVVYGDDLEAVTVEFQADPAMLRKLGGSIVGMKTDNGSAPPSSVT